MPKSKGTPVYLLDLLRMRGELDVDVRGSLRVILDPTPSGKLHIALECCACEEMLEWDHHETWWLCPGCGQEFTDAEVEKLLVACAKAFVTGTQAEDEQLKTDERGEDGRWRERVKSWIRGH